MTDCTLGVLCFMSMVSLFPPFISSVFPVTYCVCFGQAMLLETWKLYFPPIKLPLWKSIQCLKALSESFKALAINLAFFLHQRPGVTVWKENIVGRLWMPRFGLKHHLMHVFLLDGLFGWIAGILADAFSPEIHFGFPGSFFFFSSTWRWNLSLFYKNVVKYLTEY